MARRILSATARQADDQRRNLAAGAPLYHICSIGGVVLACAWQLLLLLRFDVGGSGRVQRYRYARLPPSPPSVLHYRWYYHHTHMQWPRSAQITAAALFYIDRSVAFWFGGSTGVTITAHLDS